MNKESRKALATFLALATEPGFSQIFGGMPLPEEKHPYERLGENYELRPIQIFDEKSNLLENLNNYSHLYHNGLKVTEKIFRKGGMGGDFRDGYCSLIHYTKDEKREDRFSFGTHVIINRLGEIVLEGTGISEYPSLQGGNVGKLKDTYYDLRNSEPILTVSSSGAISSKNLIIVEHRYDWYNKNLPLGVYTINKETCEVTKIDEVK